MKEIVYINQQNKIEKNHNGISPSHEFKANQTVMFDNDAEVDITNHLSAKSTSALREVSTHKLDPRILIGEPSTDNGRISTRVFSMEKSVSKPNNYENENVEITHCLPAIFSDKKKTKPRDEPTKTISSVSDIESTECIPADGNPLTLTANDLKNIARPLQDKFPKPKSADIKTELLFSKEVFDLVDIETTQCLPSISSIFMDNKNLAVNSAHSFADDVDVTITKCLPAHQLNRKNKSLPFDSKTSTLSEGSNTHESVFCENEDIFTSDEVFTAATPMNSLDSDAKSHSFFANSNMHITITKCLPAHLLNQQNGALPMTLTQNNELLPVTKTVKSSVNSPNKNESPLNSNEVVSSIDCAAETYPSSMSSNMDITITKCLPAHLLNQQNGALPMTLTQNNELLPVTKTVKSSVNSPNKNESPLNSNEVVSSIDCAAETYPSSMSSNMDITITKCLPAHLLNQQNGALPMTLIQNNELLPVTKTIKSSVNSPNKNESPLNSNEVVSSIDCAAETYPSSMSSNMDITITKCLPAHLLNQQNGALPMTLTQNNELLPVTKTVKSSVNSPNKNESPLNSNEVVSSIDCAAETYPSSMSSNMDITITKCLPAHLLNQQNGALPMTLTQNNELLPVTKTVKSSVNSPNKNESPLNSNEVVSSIDCAAETYPSSMSSNMDITITKCLPAHLLNQQNGALPMTLTQNNELLPVTKTVKSSVNSPNKNESPLNSNEVVFSIDCAAETYPSSMSSNVDITITKCLPAHLLNQQNKALPMTLTQNNELLPVTKTVKSSVNSPNKNESPLNSNEVVSSIDCAAETYPSSMSSNMDITITKCLPAHLLNQQNGALPMTLTQNNELLPVTKTVKSSVNSPNKNESPLNSNEVVSSIDCAAETYPSSMSSNMDITITKCLPAHLLNQQNKALPMTLTQNNELLPVTKTVKSSVNSPNKNESLLISNEVVSSIDCAAETYPSSMSSNMDITITKCLPAHLLNQQNGALPMTLTQNNELLPVTKTVKSSVNSPNKNESPLNSNEVVSSIDCAAETYPSSMSSNVDITITKCLPAHLSSQENLPMTSTQSESFPASKTAKTSVSLPNEKKSRNRNCPSVPGHNFSFDLAVALDCNADVKPNKIKIPASSVGEPQIPSRKNDFCDVQNTSQNGEIPHMPMVTNQNCLSAFELSKLPTSTEVHISVPSDNCSAMEITSYHQDPATLAGDTSSLLPMEFSNVSDSFNIDLIKQIDIYSPSSSQGVVAENSLSNDKSSSSSLAIKTKDIASHSRAYESSPFIKKGFSSRTDNLSAYLQETATSASAEINQPTTEDYQARSCKR